jgi:hypothetical protein
MKDGPGQIRRGRLFSVQVLRQHVLLARAAPPAPPQQTGAEREHQEGEARERQERARPGERDAARRGDGRGHRRPEDDQDRQVVLVRDLGAVLVLTHRDHDVREVDVRVLRDREGRLADLRLARVELRDVTDVPDDVIVDRDVEQRDVARVRDAVGVDLLLSGGCGVDVA